MNFIESSDVPTGTRADGSTNLYHLFKDYEVIFGEQAPHSKQDWHHHEVIAESIFVVDGPVVAYWREDGKELRREMNTGDLVETERSPHTFANESDKVARTICFKRMPVEQDYHETFKNDKILD